LNLSFSAKPNKGGGGAPLVTKKKNGKNAKNENNWKNKQNEKKIKTMKTT